MVTLPWFSIVIVLFFGLFRFAFHNMQKKGVRIARGKAEMWWMLSFFTAVAGLALALVGGLGALPFGLHPMGDLQLPILVVLAAMQLFVGTIYLHSTRLHEWMAWAFIGLVLITFQASESILPVQSTIHTFHFLNTFLFVFLSSIFLVRGHFQLRSPAFPVGVGFGFLGAFELLRHILLAAHQGGMENPMLLLVDLLMITALSSWLLYQGYRQKSRHPLYVDKWSDLLPEERSTPLSQLIKASHLPFIIHQSGVIQSANPSFCSMLGIAASDMVPGGLFAAKTLREWVHPEDHPAYDELMALTNSGTEKASGMKEVRLLRPDGKVLWTLLIHRNLIWEGEDASWATIIDTTLLKQAEKQLGESALIQKAIVQNAPYPMSLKDTEGNYMLVNQAWCDYFQVSQEEVLHRNVLDLPNRSEKEKQEIMAEDKATLELGKALNSPPRKVFLQDGRTRYVETYKAPLIDDKGEMIGVVGISVDITERINLQDVLVETQKMEALGKLTGGVAHDFNNLLQSIGGYSTLAMASLDSNDKTTFKHLEKVHEAVDKAAILIDQLLSFSRSQMLQKEKLILGEVMTGSLELIKHILGSQYQLVLETSDDSQPIMADKGMMEQLIVNLVTNAKEAQPEGGEIRLEIDNASLDEAFCQESPWAAPGDYVRLTFQDQGVGIPDNILPYIFDPFFTTKEAGAGSGLGLSSLYGIVKQHNGLVDVKSLEGVGTTFQIYLPIENTEEAKTSPDLAQPEAIKTPRQPENIEALGPSILVAEDDPAVRNLLVDILDSYGYKVFTVKDGQEALLFCEKMGTSLDMVVSDVVMPNMSGREFQLHLRKLHPKIPVLFVSGYNTEEMDFINGEYQAFLPKPFQPHELVRSMESLMHKCSTNNN